MNTAMLRLIVTRLAVSLLTLWIVSLLVFGATALLPGDAAQAVLGPAATPEAVASLRAVLHLDQPGWLRYLVWLGGLLHGDPGRSLVNHLAVTELIGSRLPNSLLLAALTGAFSVPLALTLGITAAVWRGSLFDRVTSLLVVGIVSVPEFLVATLAVLLFAVKLHWLPALASIRDVHTATQMLRSFAMPVLSLSCVVMAQMTRMSRAALIGTLDASYVEMARLKGAGPARIVLRHALPNMLGPIVNAMALSLAFLLGGVIIIETIFNYPGLAKLMVDAVATRDMPVVQACAMIFCAGYLLLTTLADIVAILSNPRLRTA